MPDQTATKRKPTASEIAREEANAAGNKMVEVPVVDKKTGRIIKYISKPRKYAPTPVQPGKVIIIVDNESVEVNPAVDGVFQLSKEQDYQARKSIEAKDAQAKKLADAKKAEQDKLAQQKAKLEAQKATQLALREEQARKAQEVKTKQEEQRLAAIGRQTAERERIAAEKSRKAEEARLIVAQPKVKPANLPVPVSPKADEPIENDPLEPLQYADQDKGIDIGIDKAPEKDIYGLMPGWNDPKNGSTYEERYQKALANVGIDRKDRDSSLQGNVSRYLTATNQERFDELAKEEKKQANRDAYAKKDPTYTGSDFSPELANDPRSAQYWASVDPAKTAQEARDKGNVNRVRTAQNDAGGDKELDEYIRNSFRDSAESTGSFGLDEPNNELSQKVAEYDNIKNFQNSEAFGNYKKYYLEHGKDKDLSDFDIARYGSAGIVDFTKPSDLAFVKIKKDKAAPDKTIDPKRQELQRAYDNENIWDYSGDTSRLYPGIQSTEDKPGTYKPEISNLDMVSEAFAGNTQPSANTANYGPAYSGYQAQQNTAEYAPESIAAYPTTTAANPPVVSTPSAAPAGGGAAQRSLSPDAPVLPVDQPRIASGSGIAGAGAKPGEVVNPSPTAQQPPANAPGMSAVPPNKQLPLAPPGSTRVTLPNGESAIVPIGADGKPVIPATNAAGQPASPIPTEEFLQLPGLGQRKTTGPAVNVSWHEGTAIPGHEKEYAESIARSQQYDKDIQAAELDFTNALAANSQESMQRAKDKADFYDKAKKDLDRRMEVYHQRGKVIHDQIDRKVKELDNYKFDNSMEPSLGGLIGMALQRVGLALGAYASTRAGTPNYAMELYKQLADEQLQRQKLDYEKKKGTIGALQSNYGMLREMAGDDNVADSMYRTLVLEQIAARAENATITGTNEVAKANYRKQAAVAKQLAEIEGRKGITALADYTSKNDAGFQASKRAVSQERVAQSQQAAADSINKPENAVADLVTKTNQAKVEAAQNPENPILANRAKRLETQLQAVQEIDPNATDIYGESNKSLFDERSDVVAYRQAKQDKLYKAQVDYQQVVDKPENDPERIAKKAKLEEAEKNVRLSQDSNIVAQELQYKKALNIRLIENPADGEKVNKVYSEAVEKQDKLAKQKEELDKIYSERESEINGRKARKLELEFQLAGTDPKLPLYKTLQLAIKNIDLYVSELEKGKKEETKFVKGKRTVIKPGVPSFAELQSNKVKLEAELEANKKIIDSRDVNGEYDPEFIASALGTSSFANAAVGAIKGNKVAAKGPGEKPTRISIAQKTEWLQKQKSKNPNWINFVRGAQGGIRGPYVNDALDTLIQQYPGASGTDIDSIIEANQKNVDDGSIVSINGVLAKPKPGANPTSDDVAAISNGQIARNKYKALAAALETMSKISTANSVYSNDEWNKAKAVLSSATGELARYKGAIGALSEKEFSLAGNDFDHFAQAVSPTNWFEPDNKQKAAQIAESLRMLIMTLSMQESKFDPIPASEASQLNTLNRLGLIRWGKIGSGAK